jgi:hypothetical protein
MTQNIEISFRININDEGHETGDNIDKMWVPVDSLIGKPR